MVNSLLGPQIDCKNVSLIYNKNIILDDITLTIEAGKINSVIGPNGGGKSSLIKSLLGQTPFTGKIEFKWDDSAKQIIGYVPQYVSIDKTLPVNIEDFLKLCVEKRAAFFKTKKEFKKAIAPVLEELNLAGKEKYMFSELSGGERQRVIFAQALIPTPECLILDEPMNNLDESGISIFLKKIKELSEMGITIIWIHHDILHIKELASKTFYINKKLVFSGNGCEVEEKLEEMVHQDSLTKRA